MRPLAGLFPPTEYPEVIVGLDSPDDAAVYSLGDGRAIISTCDFFPPVVDSPYEYGLIAAANALSDVYAMGGTVLFAINIAVFPQCLDADAVTDILRGGAEKVRESGGAVAGGHTIEGPEPLYGLAVTGSVPLERLWTKAGARPGDDVVLTKPVGSGMVVTAAKADAAAPAHLDEAVAWMSTLNRAAAEAAGGLTVHAATDVTGFSLLGHAVEMARAGGVQIDLLADAVPLISGAAEYADQWLFPAGTNNNEAAFAASVTFADVVPQERRLLLFTPETSGGLLLAMPPDAASAYMSRAASAGMTAWRVGSVSGGRGQVTVA